MAQLDKRYKTDDFTGRKKRKNSLNLKHYASGNTYCNTCTNKHEVIEYLSRDKSFHTEFIKKMGIADGRHYRDLMQDMYVTLLDKDDKLIMDLNSRGQLLYYLKGLVFVNVRSNSSLFYAKYKKLMHNSIEETGIPNDDIYGFETQDHLKEDEEYLEYRKKLLVELLELVKSRDFKVKRKEYAIAFLDRFERNMLTKDIAAKHGVSIPTAQSWIGKVTKQLNKIYKERK